MFSVLHDIYWRGFGLVSTRPIQRSSSRINYIITCNWNVHSFSINQKNLTTNSRCWWKSPLAWQQLFFKKYYIKASKFTSKMAKSSDISQNCNTEYIKHLKKIMFVCNMHISRTFHSFYFTLGRFVVEDSGKRSVEFGAILIQYCLIFNISLKIKTVVG